MHIDVVAGHAHLGALGQGDDAGNVGGAEVELRTIVVEERGVTAALFLLQDIDMAVEGGVGMNGAGNSDDLAALDLVAVDTTQQGADVVAGLSELQALAEHFEAGDGGGQLLFLQADDFHLVADMGGAALDTAGSDGAAAGDGHDVLNGHQEGLVSRTVGSGDILVDSVHQLPDAGILGGVGIGGGALQSLQGGAADDRGVVAVEVLAAQQLTDLHLDQVEQLVVVDHVALVHEDNDLGHADLTGQQDVLAGLGHGTIGSSDDQDSAVHLSSTGDHVLDIVSMARAVNVGVVTLLGVVLDVSGVDRDAAGLLFGGLVDAGVIHEVRIALQGQDLGDGSRQSGLAVVNVTDGTNVDMLQRAVKFFLFSHWKYPPLYKTYRCLL